MTDAIKSFFVDILGAEGGVFLCSMIPIVELRGAIPMGFILGLPWWKTLIISIIGNLLPVPFILLFIRAVIQWMSKSKVKLFNKIANWLLAKVDKNKDKIQKYAFWGVAAFVAIPLPATGAWTGSLVAAMIDLKFWKAFLSAVIGVVVAGIVVTLIAYGGVGLIVGLFA